MTTRTPGIRFLPVLLFAAAAACTAPVTTPDAAVRAEPHADSGDRLRDIMHHMKELVDVRRDTVKMTDAQRAQYLKDLVNTAGEVVIAAERLVNSGPARDLGPGTRRRFYDLADRLYAQAANVENQAKQSNFMDMDQAYHGLDETCRDCHRLFRDR
jgi:cytochrome c556